MNSFSYIVANLAVAASTTMNDTTKMETFDDIEVRRPDLAKSYLSLLAAQPGRPLHSAANWQNIFS